MTSSHSLPVSLLLLLMIALAATGLTGCASGHPQTATDILAARKQAFVAYQEGDYPLAISRFEELTATIPKDADLWFRLGNAYARNKQPKKAVSAYENALLRDPELSKAWYNMGLVYLKEAMKTFDEMSRYVPAEDPAGQRGRFLRDALVRLLQRLSGQPTTTSP